MSQRLKGLKEHTLVMGILNVTPDSFSDGGQFFNKDKAIERAIRIEKEGADIIDIGGESTRPGATPVSDPEELDRVVPVIDAIRSRVKIPISIDTRKSKVAMAAIQAGATIINDISGLRFDPNIATVAAKHETSLVLMHSKGLPETMQVDPRYDDVMLEIIDSLRGSIRIAHDAGVSDEQILIDPGIGFGKTLEHNLKILNDLDKLTALGFPICIGTSRKSFIGKILGIEDPEERMSGTIASSVIAIMKGASVVRVHDVKQMVQAAKITDAILRKGCN